MSKQLAMAMAFVLVMMSGCTSEEDAIDEILIDIPLPPEFDRIQIEQPGLFERGRRYQLIAETTRVVTCGWLDQWFTATEEGDEELAAEAAAALETSRQWAALVEIVDDGDWSEAIWEYANAVNRGPGIRTGFGNEAPTREMVADGLGCR